MGFIAVGLCSFNLFVLVGWLGGVCMTVDVCINSVVM